MAAGLGSMVAGMSRGKKAYVQYERELSDALARLAELREEEFAWWLSHTPVPAVTPHTITKPASLRGVVSKVRKSGWAVSKVEKSGDQPAVPRRIVRR